MKVFYLSSDSLANSAVPLVLTHSGFGTCYNNLNNKASLG